MTYSSESSGAFCAEACGNSQRLQRKRPRDFELNMATCRRSCRSDLSISLAIVATIACLGQNLPRAQGEQIGIREHEARMIYYLLKFVSFPDRSLGDKRAPLEVCVVGDRWLTDAMAATTRGATVRGRRVKVIQRRACGLFLGCHVAVLTTRCDLTADFYADADRQQVLTIANEDHSHPRSLIGIRSLQGQTRLRVRLEEAQRAGFRISSELLALAEIVRE